MMRTDALPFPFWSMLVPLVSGLLLMSVAPATAFGTFDVSAVAMLALLVSSISLAGVPFDRGEMRSRSFLLGLAVGFFIRQVALYPGTQSGVERIMILSFAVWLVAVVVRRRLRANNVRRSTLSDR